MNKKDILTEENLKIALKCLTGEMDVKSVDHKNSELMEVLNFVGLCGNTPKGFVIYNSRNCIPADAVDRKEDAEKFVSMTFRFNTDLSRVPLVVTKMPGDTYACVQTCGNDEHKSMLIATIMFVQDSRNPWIQIPGDMRPTVMTVNIKDKPSHNKGTPYFDSWHKVANQDGTKSPMCVVGRIRPFHIYAIMDEINSRYFGMETKTVSKQHFYNLNESFEFCNSSGQAVSINGSQLEIVKDSGSNIGEIYVDSTKIGECTMQKSNMTTSRLVFKIEQETLKQTGLTRTDVYDNVQNMFIQKKPQVKKFGKGRMSEEFSRAGI